jgi:hypothetical protein
MATELDAVFENGVFRPLEPVHLPEHLRVRGARQRSRQGPPQGRHSTFCSGSRDRRLFGALGPCKGFIDTGVLSKVRIRALSDQ